MNRNNLLLGRKWYKLLLIILTCLLFVPSFLEAQQSFQGSFLMTFKVADGQEEPPLRWNIESMNNGGKMGFEIEDDIRKKGVIKRVLFNPADSAWTMLMELNNIKQGTRIRRAAMFKSDSLQTVKVNRIGQKKNVAGYICSRYVIESSNYISELWVTDQLGFDLCNIYKLMSHCGVVGESIRKGDWFKWKQAKGMVLEVTSKKKSTGESYSVYISEIKPGETNDALFAVKGFRIAEIPEGLNCGFSAEEK